MEKFRSKQEAPSPQQMTDPVEAIRPPKLKARSDEARKGNSSRVRVRSGLSSGSPRAG